MRTVRAVLVLALALACGALVVSAAQGAATATVRGTVTVTGGAPLTSGFVQLIDPSLEPDPEPRAISFGGTDNRGRFSLAGVPAGRYELAVEDMAERWAPRVVPVTVTRTGSVEVPVRLDRGRTITGRVLEGDGTPAARARVLVWDDSPYRWLRTTLTDTDGRYALTALTAAPHRGQLEPGAVGDGTWATQCLGGRHVPDVNWYEHPELDDGPQCAELSRVVDPTAGDVSAGTETLRHRNAVVTGVVRDLAGRGLVDVDLQVRSFYQVDNDFEAHPWQRARSDAQGRYRVAVTEDDSQRLETDVWDADGRLLVSGGAPMPTPGLGRTATRDITPRIGSTVTATARSPKRRVAVVRVRVAPLVGTGAPSGTVVVRYKRHSGKAATVTGRIDRSGHVSVRLTKVRSGTRTLTVTYPGSPRSIEARTTLRTRVR